MKEKFKKFLNLFLRFGVSIILLFFLFKQVDEKTLLALVKNTDKPLLALACVTFFVPYLLCFFRWQMLLKAFGIHLPLKRVFISFSGGIFFSLFLPSTIGGDLVRSLDLANCTKKPKEVVASVLLDRLSGYIGLSVVALFMVLFGWKFLQDESILVSISVITVLLVLVLLVLFNTKVFSLVNKFLAGRGAGKIRESITRLHQEIHYFKNKKPVIVKNILISVLIQAVAPLVFYFTALSLGIRINIAYFFIFLPIISAITLLPISIGGLGLRDVTIIYFFAKAGVAKDPAFAMSLISFSFILLYGIIGGIIYVLTISDRRLQHHQSSAILPQP